MASKRDGWHTQFARVLTTWTGLVQLPWALAVGMAASDWGAWGAWGAWSAWGGIGLGLVAWVVPVVALRPVVLDVLPDRPRNPWRVSLLERPFFIHWSATHICVLGWLLGLIGWALDLGKPWWLALGSYAVAILLFTWGAFLTCRSLSIRRADLFIDGLPPEFDGYRIAHLSDLHVGSFTEPSLVSRWLDRIRKEGADLTVITGDLVTSGTAFHEAIAQCVGSLKSPDGVVVVPGNHDYFGDGQPLFGMLVQQGVRLLRNEHFLLRRANAMLVVAGIDDRWTKRMDLRMALRDRPSAVTILLAHDPSVFDEAKGWGVEVVLCGHTHGGQIGVPGLARHINLTRFSNPYSLGIYREAGSTLVVHGGMGCTGLPIRIGVPPEVRLLCLKRPEEA